MRLKYFILGCCCLFAISCGKEESARLPAAQMQKILFDIHLAETYSMSLHKDSTKRNTERNLDSLAVFYASIFKHHKITQEEFEQSLDWYKQNPEELDSIYTNLIPEVSKLESQYD